MNDTAKINTTHLHRSAYVYLRQSSPHQVVHNRESTERQYALVSKATALGWPLPLLTTRRGVFSDNRTAEDPRTRRGSSRARVKGGYRRGDGRAIGGSLRKKTRSTWVHSAPSSSASSILA